MPALSDAVGLNLSSQYGPLQLNPTPSAVPPVNGSQEPVFTGLTRCPLPLLSNTTSDNLRTYYQNSVVPQFRLSNPSPSPVVSQPTVNNVTQVTQAITNTIAALNFTGTIASPGYIVFPFPSTNPFILQWGLTPTPTSPGTQGTITFPKSFAVAVLGINMTGVQVSGQHTSLPSTVQGAITLTNFQWTIGTGTDTDGLCPAYWWAWGQ